MPPRTRSCRLPGSASRASEVESAPRSHPWRAAKGCRPIGGNRRCAAANNPLDCLLALRSRFDSFDGFQRSPSVTYAHAANHRRDGFQRSPSADWSALAAWQTRAAEIARVTSRFLSAHLPLLAVIARCTNVLTNAPFGRFARAFDLALRGLLASFRVLAARESGYANHRLPRRIRDVVPAGK